MNKNSLPIWIQAAGLSSPTYLMPQVSRQNNKIDK